MQFAPNNSKSAPPRPPRQFYRQRLFEKLAASSSNRVILLVGQAGQGKSTLASCYADSWPKLKTWINIDSSDQDPISFMLALTGALKTRQGQPDLRQLESNLAAYEKATRKDYLFGAWARLLWQAIPQERLVVLDGLERIPFESPTLQLIQQMVDFAPSGVQFLITSRKQPPLRLQKLKVDGRALVIDNQQLAFRLAETSAFLATEYGLELDERTRGRIQAVTEGWISGVIIFAQWLARSQSAAGRKLFHTKLEWPVAQELYAFFSEEVFQSIGQDLQDFLIRTAFLETVEPRCADRMLDTEDSVRLLRQLAEETFFVQPYVSEQGEMFYRYHQLFQRFLMHKHRGELDEGQRRRLLREAADYYLQTGRPETSLPFYIEAGCFNRAEQAIAAIGMQMVKQGQLAKLKSYLEKIPEDKRRDLPWLALYHSVAIRPQAGGLAMEQLSRCLELFTSAGEYHGRLIALSFLIETALLLGYSQIPIDSLLEQARQLLENPPERALALVQANLWLQLGYAAIRGVGDFPTGLAACRTAFLIGQKEGHVEICAYALGLQKLVEIYLGHFEQAAALDAALVELLPSCSEEVRTFHISTDCVLYIYQGEGQKALETLERFGKTIEDYGFHHFHTWLMIYKCLLYPRIGRAAEAEANLKAWLHTCQEGSFSRAMALLFLGFCAYHRAAVAEGAEYLREAVQIFDKGPLRSDFQYHAAVKALGIAAYMLADHDRAERLFNQALDYARLIGSDSLMADVFLFMGLNSYAAGRLQTAAVNLRAGFKLARKHRYTHFVVIHEDDLACACLVALKLEALDDPQWVIELLVRSQNYAVEKELASLAQSAGKESQLAKAAQVVYRARLPRIRVYTLGRFTVDLDGRPLSAAQWKGKSNTKFFKALCAGGGRRVPKERLAEALWPGVSPRASENNFKSGLHRLRMVFAPFGGERAGFQYLVLHQSMVGLDSELCWLDLEAFREAASAALAEDSLPAVRSLGDKALELYQGDFLPDDIYQDWAAPMRAELRKLYLEVLGHLAAVCAQEQDLPSASRYLETWLEADPYSNTACRRLMRLYDQQGQRKKALLLYRDFARRHKTDLDFEPDDSTRELYHRLSD